MHKYIIEVAVRLERPDSLTIRSAALDDAPRFNLLSVGTDDSQCDFESPSLVIIDGLNPIDRPIAPGTYRYARYRVPLGEVLLITTPPE